jgi:hypothetical protein
MNRVLFQETNTGKLFNRFKNKNDNTDPEIHNQL